MPYISLLLKFLIYGIKQYTLYALCANNTYIRYAQQYYKVFVECIIYGMI